MAENAAARAEVLRTRDLIGWAVADPAGATVGTVSDLLIGRDGRVRFLAVKRGLLLGASVLVPVDELEWGEQSLRLTRWLDADLRRLPTYEGDRPMSAEVLAEMERAHPRFYGPPLPFDAPGVEGGTRVVPLREAREFRLPKGSPNVRGWNVFGDDHERVGVVEEMLVDPAEMKVRFLDVDVADDLFLLKEDRHVIIPIEAVELRERGQDVWVHGLNARDIAMLPAHTGGSVDPLVEMRVRDAFAGRAAQPSLPPSHAAQPVSPAAPPPVDHSEQPLASADEDGTVDYAEPVSRVDLPPPPLGAPVHDPPPYEDDMTVREDEGLREEDGLPPPLPPERTG